MLESREVVGSPLLAIVGADEDLITDDEVGLPAGVVALGRGCAGEVGALSLPDGRLAGLLRLEGAGTWGAGEVGALAGALPAAACQLVTVRRPVALERHEAGWRAIGRLHPERAALAAGLVDE